MPLDWTDIAAHAATFAREWADAEREAAEKQLFYRDFFALFGINVRRVGAYEVQVQRLTDGKRGAIDLFWPSVLLVEHKSRGESLDKAHSQAAQYLDSLDDDRLPRYLLISDFARMRLHDLDANEQVEFELADLPKHIRHFRFMLGQTTRPVTQQEPVNRRAANLMAELHDALAEDGYNGHELEVLLVRLLYCFFADDTGLIEPRDHLHNILESTSADGGNLGPQLTSIFTVLDTKTPHRQRSLPEDLLRLPYVNGGLFRERLPRVPAFTKKTRELLLRCSAYDWSQVNPVIFGGLFQSVENVQERRRGLGLHYTSEENILKLIGPLFLDRMHATFEAAKHDPRALRALLAEIRETILFDPACGCGNFLVVGYRELRALELSCWERILSLEPAYQEFHDTGLAGIQPSNLFGLEYEEFPQQIAIAAVHLVDHQMNLRLSALLGEARIRLPLTDSPTIEQRNALRVDWKTFCPPVRLERGTGSRFKDQKYVANKVYIIGNPPYVGKSQRSAEQQADMDVACARVAGYGDLDYVAAWYIKAIEYLQGTPLRCGFVSTNSICQGEQAGILWPYLTGLGARLTFAHRTFRWANEASHNANVFVVIIGLTVAPAARGEQAILWDYATPDATPVATKGPNLNPYLILHESNIVVQSRSTPLGAVPPIINGNKPVDNKRLLFSEDQRVEFLREDPRAARYLRRFISAEQYINGEIRWCLWLTDEDRGWSTIPTIIERISQVREFRLDSTKPDTRRIAAHSHRFGQIRQPTERYIVIPRHSSEQRAYIPMGYIDPSHIVADSSTAIPGATPAHFGILQSDMHMAWVRHVCGRIKSDFRYSNEIVYNTFPWPDLTPSSEARLAKLAQRILDIHHRRLGPQYGCLGDETLATLYNRDTMPGELVDAHRDLSREVDRCYQPRAFRSDRERMELLLTLYRDRINHELASRAAIRPVRKARG